MAISAKERDRRIVTSAGFGIFQRLVQVGSTFVIFPLMLRALGAAGFGIWGAATSLAWMAGLVDIGTGSALVTLVARSLARDRVDEARDQITGGYTIAACLGCLMLAVALAIRLGGGLQNRADVYLIALVGMAINIPLSVSNNVWMALQKGYVSGLWELVQTVLTTVGVVLCCAFTSDVRVYVAAVYGSLVVANLGSLTYLFLRHPELRPRRLPESIGSLREVAGSGILFFILNLTGGVSYMFDNVLALQLLGPEASASMTIALRICMTAFGMLAVLAQPLWPAFTDAAHRSDRRWIRRTLLRGTGLLVSATLAGSVILILFGERLLGMWMHSNLGIGSTLLWAICLWVLAQALVRIPVLLLNGLGFIRFQIYVLLGVNVVAFAAKFALARPFGPAGIISGTTIAVLIAAPIFALRIYRWADHSARQDLVPSPVLETAGGIAG